MDIFQMIGDFLHLLAMLMLVLKILANKNVIGNVLLTWRSFLQNAINIPCCLRGQIYRLNFRMEKFLSVHDENCFHRINSIHNVPYETKKTFQFKLWQIIRYITSLLYLYHSVDIGNCHSQVIKSSWFCLVI